MDNATGSLSERARASARMVVACLLIVTVSMTLDVPNAALSAYLVFFVSREDMASTALTGIVMVIAVSIAIALTLLCDLVTFDNPALRVALMATIFCVGMFLSRVLTAGPVGFGLGFVLLLTQSTVDLYQAPEALVRDTLWTWVAFSFAIAVAVIIHLTLFPTRPLVLLRQEAQRCLTFVAASLEARHAGTAPPAPIAAANRLSALLRLARIGNARLRSSTPRLDEAARALTFLVDASSMLNALPAATVAPGRLTLLAETCTRFAAALGTRQGLSQPLLPPAALHGTDAALLEEIGIHLCALAAAWEPCSSLRPEQQQARHLFVADAVSNPAHLRFALKTTFAAMLCYIIYTTVAWPGIHTCVITCAVIALTSQGATIHKAALRLAGALVGGAQALLATVFVVPHLESIGGLLLVIAPVAAMSAWISAGSERNAYFGWQIAFAFFLCILHGVGPSADVTLVRDRLLGILLGIVVMAWVFRHVWPERASARLRGILSQALRAVAALPATPSLSPDAFAAQRRAVLALLAEAERTAVTSAFEQRAAANDTGDASLLSAARGVILDGLNATQCGAAPKRQV
jgi:multidrug resistance protein MdtO